ncbi:MAG: putative dihydropteroate synthase [Ilumatobacteraceae bacterium]|nr:putative dihydropteroate synthase [Ilumatobacteraceae bacterium]
MTKIMGILNVTPDSFSDGGRYVTVDAASERARTLAAEGADIIDVGGYSSRPGASDISPEEEAGRVLPVVERLRSELPDVPLSIDTFRPSVARAAIERGVSIINDICGGRDPGLVDLAAEHGATYIVMHMQGTPQTMHRSPRYDDVVGEVREYLARQVAALRARGVRDVWCDPGFGFGKTIEHNFELLARLAEITGSIDAPTMVGLSRKSMFWRPLDVRPEEAEAASSAAHLAAIRAGASMIRVHDVAAARQVAYVADRLGWSA